jgi:alpha-1,3-rhamnosyl/mannosyltransferase
MVGTIEPRKNLGVVLEAWRLLRDRNPETPPLVIVGKVGWKAESILPQLDQAVAAGLVIRPGYLRLAELLGLYQGSEVVVFPSVYEGFGLPVVEAFQAGKPLLASDIPVLREVADDAAMFAPPHDPEAWARALRELFDNPSRRNDLVARGTRRLADFDWRRSALTHLEVLEAAARS